MTREEQEEQQKQAVAEKAVEAVMLARRIWEGCDDVNKLQYVQDVRRFIDDTMQLFKELDD